MRRNTPPAMLVATVPLAVPATMEALHLILVTQHAAVVVPIVVPILVCEAVHVAFALEWWQ